MARHWAAGDGGAATVACCPVVLKLFCFSFVSVLFLVYFICADSIKYSCSCTGRTRRRLDITVGYWPFVGCSAKFSSGRTTPSCISGKWRENWSATMRRSPNYEAKSSGRTRSNCAGLTTNRRCRKLRCPAPSQSTSPGIL